MKKTLLLAASFLALTCTLHPAPAEAILSWPGETYCVKPAFVAGTVPPNLLLMIDNSASMYDLAYVDKGNANRQPYYCYDETYSNINSYAGYFETKDADNNDIYYQYRSATDDFVKVTGNFPFGCGSVPANTKIFPGTMCVELTKPSTLTSFVAKGNYLNWLTASKFDVEKKILTGGKYSAVTNASNAPGLVAESRGCVGQGFVKDADATNFVDYTGDSSNNLNESLGVTFTITGPFNPNNRAAPSLGGQSYINLYSGDKPYDAGKCQAAVDAINDAAGAGQVTGAVQDCLTSTTPPVGVCSIMDVDPATGLPVAHACIDTAPPATPNCQPAAVAAHCKGNNAACTTDTDCNVTGGSACSAGTVGKICGLDSDCDEKKCSITSTTCSVASDCFKAPTPGVCTKGSTPVGGCTVDSDCKTKNAVCSGYNAGYNYGTCGVATAGTCTATASSYQGPCVPATGGNLGVCQFSPHDTLVKTSVLFASSMQTCWALRKNNTQPGNDEYNSIVKNCPIIYAGYKSCSNNTLLACNADADCGSGNTCLTGPAAVGPGNSGLLCSLDYEGQLFTNSSGTTWVVKSSLPDPPPTGCSASDTVKDCMLKINSSFCSAMTAPAVTDPTDSPNTSTVITDNLPAILSGVGVDAQLGGVIKSMRVKIASASQPSGLIQDFASKIRLGTMTFNQYGSASETSVSGVGAQKTCSNNPQQVCWQNVDCGGTNTCSTTNTVNYDGGSIGYPIGLGLCATMTTTACDSDAQCSGTNTCLNGYCGTKGSTVCTTTLTCTGSSQACIGNGAGDHVNGFSLVSSIDSIKGNSWTPFAEAMYNAIGYFAAVPQANGTYKSRVTGAKTGLSNVRINAVDTTSTTFSTTSHPLDFNEVLNPSEYSCQQNYILLITDGTSTADRNSAVHNLATLYAGQAGLTSAYCPDSVAATAGTSAINYGGTSDLPILAWIGNRHKLDDFVTSGTTPTALHCSSTTSTTCTSDAQCPSGETCTNAHYPRDHVSTFVVLNGADNGVGGACNATTLLTDTAVKGGTKELHQASDYNGLKTALTTIFQEVAAKASSGTAASILSNSEGSGANILQAVFFPKKIFASQTSSDWIGEMQNLWYFVDPQVSRSTIREDSNSDKELDLIADKVVSFRFNSTDNTTYAYVSQDLNGDGIGDTAEVKEDTDAVKSIWRAGKQLWARDLTSSQRKIYTSTNGTSLIDFSSATFPGTANPNSSATLAPFLNVSSAAEATRLIDYVHGVDQPDEDGLASYRSRKVKIKDPVTGVISAAREWRLGDIISSTPRIQSTGKLNTYNLAAPSGYSDTSYASFIGSNEYKSRGMVYVGGNDGMLHSFKLGLLDVTASGTHKATLTESDLGEEQWAYIPKQALPYLKYYGDPKYNHLYYVDGSTVLLDASIGTTSNTGTCTDAAAYSDCAKQTSVVNSSYQLDASKNTWRSILIGGMGIGGASTKSCASGAECVQTPLAADPAAPSDGTKGLGYSTYFALDVTNPNAPQLMWEFNNEAMGFATTGPAIVRVGERDKNGHWYAVFGSGPTGKIDTNSNQFKGQSNQTLKFFVVDLRTGTLLRTIDTGIENAFAGSMLGGPIDADRWNTNANGHYQDDAILVGYTKKNTSTNTWSDGGVLRISTQESSTVANWTWSNVIEDTGPVVTAISRLQDRKNKNLWLYFGSGRYYYRAGSDIDDFSSQRSIYGIKDPCYNTDAMPGNLYDKNCSATVSSGNVTDQSGTISTSIGSGGWKIDLDLSSGDFGAERVVTDAVALTNGTVFLTSFMPTSDPCGFGGNSFLWALGYNTGGRPSDAALAGKALIQLSTGEFKEVDLAQAFGSGAARNYRRSGVPMTGKPPADAFPIVSKSGNKPVKRIMHIQER